MSYAAIRRSAGAAIAAALMAVGAAVFAAPANADAEADDAFIDHLDKKGVPYEDRTTAIRTAKSYCLDQTRPGSPIWVAGYNLKVEKGWTQTETAAFMEGAIYIYCPQVWDLD